MNHQKKTIDRTEKLITLLESPGIEDGAVIRLENDSEYSQLRRDLSAISSTLDVKGDEPRIKEIRALLGGDFG